MSFQLIEFRVIYCLYIRFNRLIEGISIIIERTLVAGGGGGGVRVALRRRRVDTDGREAFLTMRYCNAVNGHTQYELQGSLCQSTVGWESVS